MTKQTKIVCNTCCLTFSVLGPVDMTTCGYPSNKSSTQVDWVRHHFASATTHPARASRGASSSLHIAWRKTSSICWTCGHTSSTGSLPNCLLCLFLQSLFLNEKKGVKKSLNNWLYLGQAPCPDDFDVHRFFSGFLYIF